MINNNKNIEVELRALAKDLNTLKTEVEKTGAKFVGKSTLRDIYFCEKSITTIEEVEMHDVGSYGLRLRQYSNEKGTINTLNTKTITNVNDHHAWEEHEVEVEDFNETFKILSLTEFKPFFELEKIRTEYILGELNISLEEIKDFGGCIEIEILTLPGKEEYTKETIVQYLEKIGIPKDQILPKSVTNIVTKQRAFKTKIVV